MPGSESLSDLLSLPVGEGAEPLAARIAGRYTLGALLGQGASGSVYRAVDQFSSREVAVKLLTVLSEKQRERLVREVGALRVLRVPGVVRLLDEGELQGRSFIVMGLVEGEPFPGSRREGGWSALEGTVCALLETLTRVHAAGIIHRDLKPGNVLVDDQGHPTLLDFGLARGADQTITAAGTVVGTPRYLAPEQVHGRPVDARTDLFALGVMIYEALAGRPPHEGLTTAELLYAKDLRPRPLSRRARDVPDHVSAVIDQLLEPDPRLRPRSAATVLEALKGSGAGIREGRLPRLGTGAVVSALVEAALAGRSLDVVGPAGSGRTRTLQDAAERLNDLSLKVTWTGPARRPLESLRPLWDDTGQRVETASAESPERVMVQVVAALEGLLAQGWVILVDEWESLDRWSRQVLEGCRSAGPVLGSRLRAQGDGLALAPLTREDLRALFAGPDRLLHLREDGARELHQRTGGLPIRVAAELSAWVHRGMASWQDGQVVLDRVALERSQMGLGQEQVHHHGQVRDDLDEPLQELLAWVALGWPHTTVPLLASASGHPRWQLELELEELERAGAAHRLDDGRIQPLVAASALQDWLGRRRRDAHMAVAEALPPGAEGRLLHFIAAGAGDRVGREAAELSEQLIQQGRLGHAMAVLDEALFVVRRGPNSAQLTALLTLRTLAALLSQTAHVLRAALFALRRDRERLPEAGPLSQLLGGALAFMRGKSARAKELLDGVGPLADPRLEAYRQALQFHLAAREGRTAAGLERLRTGLLALDHPFAQARLASMEGWAAYWAQDYRVAAGHFGRSAGLAWAQSSRALGLTKASSALIEAGELEAAADLAQEAIALAADHRLPLAEGRAEWCLRTARYRQGQPLVHAPELLEALARLESDHLLGTLALVEGAGAWRAGQTGLARDLANLAQEAFQREGHRGGALLAAGLVGVCGPADPAAAQALAASVGEGLPPLVRLQVLGLAALAAPEVPGLRDAARHEAQALAAGHADLRREILSPQECAEGV